MGLFKALKDIVFTPPEQKTIAQLYADQKYWNVIVKLHNMRIAQLGEEIMGTNTMTPEGQVREHGLKERVNENEHFISLFKTEWERQEKTRRVEERKEFRQKKFRKITSLQDL